MVLMDMKRLPSESPLYTRRSVWVMIWWRVGNVYKPCKVFKSIRIAALSVMATPLFVLLQRGGNDVLRLKDESDDER